MGGKAVYGDIAKNTKVERVHGRETRKGDVSVITPPKGKHFDKRAVSRQVRSTKTDSDMDKVIRGLEREARIGMPPVSPHSENTGKGKRYKLETEKRRTFRGGGKLRIKKFKRTG